VQKGDRVAGVSYAVTQPLVFSPYDECDELTVQHLMSGCCQRADGSIVCCSKRQQIGMAVGVSVGCIVLLGVIAVPVVYMRRQWARAEENKLRLTARMSGLDESEVRSEVGARHR